MKKIVSLPPRHLKVTALAATRGDREVLTDISFTIGPGEALLVRGPNGAGKSTLLLCLAGFLRPSAGSIDWQGRDPDMRPGTDLHFLGHRAAVKPGLTVTENLSFWANVNGGDRTLVAPAIEAAGLDHAADLDAGYLSAGQTKRLAIARLLVAERPVWLLDEPTSALDAQGGEWLAGLIDTHLGKGGLVAAATHLDFAFKDLARVHTLELRAAT